MSHDFDVDFACVIPDSNTNLNVLPRSPRSPPSDESSGDPATNPSLQLNGSTDSFAAAQVVADENEAAQLRRRRPDTDAPATTTTAATADGSIEAAKRKRAAKMLLDPFDDPRYKSDGFWSDLRTGKWMLIPCETRFRFRPSTLNERLIPNIFASFVPEDPYGSHPALS